MSFMILWLRLALDFADRSLEVRMKLIASLSSEKLSSSYSSGSKDERASSRV